MSRRRWVGIVLGISACALLFWPQGALAAEQCEALNPSACMDDFLHYTLVQVMRSLWFFDRPLLMIARWVEGLRDYLVDGVLATAFDATIVGIRTPFWLIAAAAWCIFVASYMVSMIADLRWVNLRKGMWYCMLAALLFQWGSQGLAASEELRATVAQGFATLAEQSVEDAGGSLAFYASNDSSVQSPHSIYSGEADCPGASTRRPDTHAMYLNDFTANYLWATASDIHCAAATGGSTDLPQHFAKGNGSFQGYVPKQPIDSEPKEERARLIGLAQDGVMRLVLGVFMGVGAVLEQVLHLLFTLALATAWMGLLISLLFVLFVSTEGMFTSQIKAGLAILRTSWLASIWVGVMLAIVRQAANTGNAMVVFGAVMLATAVIIWQIKGAFELFLSTLSRVAESATGAAPGAIGGMLTGIGMGAVALATGGAGVAVMGGLAALNCNKGADTEGGTQTGHSSGAASYGAGVALSRIRPLRRAGQLAKAMGVVGEHVPLIEGLTQVRAADPLSWANVQRDQRSGTAHVQRIKKAKKKGSQQEAASEHTVYRQGIPTANGISTATTDRATSSPRTPSRASGAIRTDGAQSDGTQPVRSTPAATHGAATNGHVPQAATEGTRIGQPAATPRVLAQQIGALATAVAARPDGDERAALVEQIRPLVEAFYRQTGQLPLIDSAIPLRITGTPERTVRVALVEDPASPPRSNGTSATTGGSSTNGTSASNGVTPVVDSTMVQRRPQRRPAFRFVQRSNSSSGVSTAIPRVVDERDTDERRDDGDRLNTAPVSLPRSSKGYRGSSKRSAVRTKRGANLQPSTSATQLAAIGVASAPAPGAASTPVAASTAPASAAPAGSVVQAQTSATSTAGVADAALAVAGTASTPRQEGGPVQVTVEPLRKTNGASLPPSLASQRPNNRLESAGGNTTGTTKTAPTTPLGPTSTASAQSRSAPVVARDVVPQTLAVPVTPVAGSPASSTSVDGSADVVTPVATGVATSASVQNHTTAPTSASVQSHTTAPTSASVQNHITASASTAVHSQTAPPAHQASPAPSEQTPAPVAPVRPTPRTTATMPTASTAPLTASMSVPHAITLLTAAPAAPMASSNENRAAGTPKAPRRPWANRAVAETTASDGTSSASRPRTGLPRAIERRK